MQEPTARFLQALSPRLPPDEIINKQKHGFGLPFGIWMAEDLGLQELAMDNLSRMKRWRYILPGSSTRSSLCIVSNMPATTASSSGPDDALKLWLTAQDTNRKDVDQAKMATRHVH